MYESIHYRIRSGYALNSLTMHHNSAQQFLLIAAIDIFLKNQYIMEYALGML